MPSRRTHTKSRNGCVQCKLARIKCDQSSPSCSKCTKSNKKCLYALAPNDLSTTPATPHLLSPALTSPSFSSTAPATPSSPSFLVPAFEPADLELMHHYFTSTYLTLATNDPEVQETWRVKVPIEAYSHPYLMHSLLAFAALHRNSLAGAGEPRHSDTSAVRHYNNALATSKPALSNVTTDNCASLFGFSALIVLIAMALPLHSPGRQLDDPVTEFMQMSALVRGSTTIVHADLDRVKAGSMKALFPAGFLAHECDLPSDIRTALALLQRHVDACPDSDSAAKAAYKHTIQLLELCFRNTVPDPENGMVVLSWLAMVTDEYLALLHAPTLIAQVCLAHFAVLLHGLRKVWWSDDWGKKLMRWTEREGAGEWHGLLEWPKKMVD